MDDTRVMNVYGAQHQHDSVFVVLNRSSIEALRDMCDSLLNNEDIRHTNDEFFASDGEGFQLVMINESAPWTSPVWSLSELPYSAWEKGPDATTISPWDRLSKEEILKIHNARTSGD